MKKSFIKRGFSILILLLLFFMILSISCIPNGFVGYDNYWFDKVILSISFFIVLFEIYLLYKNFKVDKIIYVLIGVSIVYICILYIIFYLQTKF